MKKIISFSVWGTDNKYLKGCLANIELASIIYPNWQTRFYCAQDVTAEFKQKLQNAGGEIFEMQYIESPWEGLFWRFLPASDDDVDIFISRDIDSRLNEREAAAVDEWLRSDKDIHAMRDHIEHNVPILGGMWGCRNHILKDMQKKIAEYTNNQIKGSDQDFLRSWVWRDYVANIIVHDKYNGGTYHKRIISDMAQFNQDRNNALLLRQHAVEAREKYKEECKSNGFIIDEGFIDKTFLLPRVYEVVYDDNQVPTFDYYYHPIEYFGMHDVRSFPTHTKMSYGTHVGEIFETNE